MKIKKKTIKEEGFGGSGVGGVAGIGIAVGGDQKQAEPGVNLKTKNPVLFKKPIRRKLPQINKEDKMITFREVQQELDEQQMLEQNPSLVKGAELVARCFAARNAMHFFHLSTSSYAQHIAAQAFYEGIIPLIDTVAESIIGRYGRFQSFPNIKESSLDGLQIIGNLTKWIDTNRSMISEQSEIQNDIDTILSLCNSTAYKLRELK